VLLMGCVHHLYGKVYEDLEELQSRNHRLCLENLEQYIQF
jgi:hypothetical protein